MSADNFGGTVYKEVNVMWEEENYTQLSQDCFL